MEIDWLKAREEFPVLRNWVYLNTASFGPVPNRAREASLAHLRRRDEGACLDFIDWFAEAEHIRSEAAALVGAAADDIAFVPSTATALGWLLNGIAWKKGDEVAAFADEFPNNLYAPRALQERDVAFVEIPSPKGYFRLDEFLDRLSSRTRLVVMSSVNYATGLRPPLEMIGAELRRREILFCVDGTQSVGALKMDVRSACVDFLAVHAYKWMLCPTGIGFAYIPSWVRKWLAPSTYSWRSDKNWRDVTFFPKGSPDLPSAAMRYEGGMQNFCGLCAMGAVLEMLNGWGAERVEQRVLDVAAKTREILRSHDAVLAVDDADGGGSPIIAASFPNLSMPKLSVELRRRRIAVAIRQGRLRVSPHFFTNEDDLRQLSAALDAVVQM